MQNHNAAKTPNLPRSAMVLAAGLGKRMQPITLTRPKPLVEVNGKTLLDYGLDALERADVETIVVNVHYLADQIENHVAARCGDSARISDERANLLDSGGGIKHALDKLPGDSFYLLNADSFWIEGARPNLLRMADIWDPEKMDFLLLLASMKSAVGFNTKGDFNMDSDGLLERRRENEVAPFAYAGAAIINRSVFDGAPDGAFSINMLFDQALEKGRLFGLRLEGLWLHVGTPEAIQEAEEAITNSAA